MRLARKAMSALGLSVVRRRSMFPIAHVSLQATGSVSFAEM
jgi:hypothetical protein